jgi:hydrogenase expression/formation protein HypC
VALKATGAWHLRSSNLLPGVSVSNRLQRKFSSEIKDGNIGVVDYGDLRQEVRLDLVDVQVGEFVLVHVGFAIQKLSREEGLETRELFKQVYAAMEE